MFEGQLPRRSRTMSFEVPESVRPIRDAVYAFMTERVEPAEPALREGGPAAAKLLGELQRQAKSEGLWALGHPKELGGGGLPFLDYVYVNEVQGRSEFGQLALGTFTLQDSLMLYRYANDEQRERFLEPLVRAEIFPSFAMTEPGVSSSDPTQLTTSATLDGDEWVIRGRKWFTTYANRAAYTTVMCRTEPGAQSPYRAYSMILVPTDTPGYTIVRDTPVLGLDRPIQVHGARGVTGDPPLDHMYRHARAGRIYDGPDEVHVTTTARRVLAEYAAGRNWEFGLR